VAQLVVLLTTPAVAARVDPAALAVMAVTVSVPVLPAAVVAAARVDRRLLLAP